MNELPENWAMCELGEVIKIQNGYAFPSKDFRKMGVPLIRQSNLAGDRISLEKCVYLDPHYLETKSDFILKKNDVLIGMSGSIGKLCVYDLDGPALQNQRTGKIILISKEITFWRYVWAYLNTIERQLTDKGKGLGVLNVSGKDIESLAFYLSPLNEQRRIVKKLDQLIPKVKGCQERLQKIPRLLKRFRQSVLAAACSGKLTQDWRDSEEPERVLVGNVIEDLKYGTSKKCSYSKGGVPVLRIPNIGEGIIDHADMKYAALPKKEVETLRLKSGDILMIRSNGSVSLVGKTALVSEREKDFAYAGYLIRLRPKRSVILPEYLNMALSSSDIRLQIEIPARSTSGVNNINSGEIKKLEILLLTLEEQQEIVRRVDALFKLADQLKERYKKAKANVDRLTQSILAKAFRGELVPQDPNDEPASVLLERIKKLNPPKH